MKAYEASFPAVGKAASAGPHDPDEARSESDLGTWGLKGYLNPT